MTPVRLEPAAPWSRVKPSTTEPLRSLNYLMEEIRAGCLLHFDHKSTLVLFVFYHFYYVIVSFPLGAVDRLWSGIEIFPRHVHFTSILVPFHLGVILATIAKAKNSLSS